MATIERTILSRNTSVTLGMLIVIVAFVVYDVTWKVTTDHTLEQIEARLDNASKNGWHRRQMRLWASNAERMNASWVSPSVDSIPVGDDP